MTTMKKPSLGRTVMEVAKNIQRPESLKNINQEDIQRIILLCEEYEFVKSNRNEFSLKINKLINDIISR